MIELPFRRRDSRRFMARAFAALYGVGGLVVALTLVLPHPHDRIEGWLAGPAAAAVAVSLLLLIRGGRMPTWFFYALPPGGSLLIAMVSYGAGAQTRPAYAAFFFWSISAAFYFFPRRIAAPNVPLAVVLYAVVLWQGNEPFLAVRFIVPMAAVIVSAVLIDQLNVERGHLEREVEHMVEDLQELALTDPLTGLANRRELESQLEREFARAKRFSTAVALMMIDLDKFKDYNDVHGHLAGDRVLRDVARAWKYRLRSSDLLARYGGDEFLVMLADCGPSDAHELAKRLCSAVPHDQTCSVGVATWDGRESGEQLVRRADQALLAAKRAGRDQVYVAPLSTALD
jgi:diguanylate cyclase (GGDEF)-like protein